VKKTCCALVLVAAAGCVEFPLTARQPRPAPRAVAARPATHEAPVTPEQVNETNARDRAEALRQEIDRASDPMPAERAKNQGPARGD
jgi:hypothetical protein